MIADRMIPTRRLLRWIFPHIATLTIWSALVVAVYEYAGIDERFVVPWLPLSLVGTAVAFYLGFKNNSAYDRLWESRKIWGGIVNTSRAWGASVRSFVTPQFASGSAVEGQVADAHTRLIYRHIAWLYALRSQLLAVKPWEHAAQDGKVGRTAERFRRDYGVGLVDDEVTCAELRQLLSEFEFCATVELQNPAAQLIERQSADLRELRALDLIDDFRHMELQKLLNVLYEHQGKAERIKNYPLPRQYANSGTIFVSAFLFLLPFGMVSEFARLELSSWWSVPFSVLVGWVFQTMEIVGDYSENPFQGMANDIPTLSLCRTIEIDLRQMMGETDLPAPIEPKAGILM